MESSHILESWEDHDGFIMFLSEKDIRKVIRVAKNYDELVERLTRFCNPIAHHLGFDGAERVRMSEAIVHFGVHKNHESVREFSFPARWLFYAPSQIGKELKRRENV